MALDVLSVYGQDPRASGSTLLTANFVTVCSPLAHLEPGWRGSGCLHCCAFGYALGYAFGMLLSDCLSPHTHLEVLVMPDHTSLVPSV